MSANTSVLLRIAFISFGFALLAGVRGFAQQLRGWIDRQSRARIIGRSVAGLMEDCCYQQGRVTLESGVLLIAYTDGISDAMNASDDEWGEERMMEAVPPYETAPAKVIIERLIGEAEAFVAAAPQHDDMTAVVVRVM
jgi:hypothetical protein